MFHRFGRRSDRLRLQAILSLCLAGVAATAASAVAAPLDVDEAVRLALAAEPGIEMLESEARAVADRSVAAGILPEPSLRIGLNNYPIESGGFSTEGMTNASLGFRQAFPPGKSLKHARRSLQSQADAATASVRDRRRHVELATRQAWLSLYRWQQVRQQLAASRPFFADLLAVSQSRYAVGARTQQDVLRAEIELGRLDDRTISAELAAARSEAELARWVGAAASRPLAANLPHWPFDAGIDEVRAMLGSHPLNLRARSEREARDAAVRAAEERQKPRWALDVGYAHRDGLLADGRPRSAFATVGVTVDLPFARRRSIDSELRAALAERSAAVARQDLVERQLLTELRAEYARFEQLGQRLELFEDRLLGPSDANARAALEAYQSDATDFESVMRAYIDVLDLRTQYIELKVARAQSFASLAYLGGF